MPNTNTKIRRKLIKLGHRFCAYCGIEIVCCAAHGKPILTVDHIFPKSKGGTKAHSNDDWHDSC